MRTTQRSRLGITGTDTGTPDLTRKPSILASIPSYASIKEMISSRSAVLLPPVSASASASAPFLKSRTRTTTTTSTSTSRTGRTGPGRSERSGALRGAALGHDPLVVLDSGDCAARGRWADGCGCPRSSRTASRACGGSGRGRGAGAVSHGRSFAAPAF